MKEMDDKKDMKAMKTIKTMKTTKNQKPMKAIKTMKGRSISPGIAEGEAIVSSEPIGFYGGVDAKSGIVINEGHELKGRSISGKILVFPCGKGSTVGSYVIYGLKKNGVAPSAIINEETETIVATGVILAGIPCVDKINIKELGLKTGDLVRVDGENGVVEKID